MRSNPLPFLLLLGTLSACDYVGFPDNSGSGGNNNNTDGPARKVLLEDITGHKCNNCPAAADQAKALQDIYGDALIVVGVHATAFAEPGSPPYTADHRTSAGEEYATTFQVDGLPVGLVSRALFNNALLIGDGSWSPAVASIINTPADVEVLIDTVAYNSVANSITFEVKIVPVNTLDGIHNLTVYLTEDSVIAPQIDNRATPPDVPNYVHRHMLRDNLNGTWGAQLGTGSLPAGDTITVPFTYTLPTSVLEPAHCAVVAYVYRTDTYEVLQVEEHGITH
ncbi:MAG: Omp28 family outer membrane lipoprotein [Flavobacteriales bacterium]|nr:Omp28 family outer membrane lipoprotein [Flavobacteriales bacterium]